MSDRINVPRTKNQDERWHFRKLYTQIDQKVKEGYGSHCVKVSASFTKNTIQLITKSNKQVIGNNKNNLKILVDNLKDNTMSAEAKNLFINATQNEKNKKEDLTWNLLLKMLESAVKMQLIKDYPVNPSPPIAADQNIELTEAGTQDSEVQPAGPNIEITEPDSLDDVEQPADSSIASTEPDASSKS